MDTSSPRLLTTENRKHLVRHADESIDLFKLLARIDKPIIAAVHGYALGAGCSLALGSDLVVAAESARFGFPELRAGLTASTVTAHAVHVMGRKIAFELLMLCENITPQRAYELGLVNRVVPDDQLLPAALAMAEIIAKWNPEFVGQTKRTFHRAASLDMDEALEMARDVSVMMARLPTGCEVDSPFRLAARFTPASGHPLASWECRPRARTEHSAHAAPICGLAFLGTALLLSDSCRNSPMPITSAIFTARRD